MLHLFRAAPEAVRCELTEAKDGEPCRLTIHHAHGAVVESFRTAELAIRRLHELEDVLCRAFEDRFRRVRGHRDD